MAFLRLLQGFMGILFLLAVGNLTRADENILIQSIESNHYIVLNAGITLSEPDLVLFDI